MNTNSGIDIELIENRVRRNCNWSKLYMPNPNVDFIMKREKELSIDYQNIFYKHYGTQDYVI